MTTRRKQSRSPPVPSTGASAAGGSRLVLENVRCFVRSEVPLGAQVTVIIGQNGSGKTSIVEALASLAPGDGEGLDRFPLRHGGSTGAIALYGAGPEPIARWTEEAGRSERARLPRGHHIFAYGQYRALRPPVRPRQATGPALLGPEWEQALTRALPVHLEDALRRPATRTLVDFDEYLFRDLAAYVALLEERGEYDPAARAVWTRLHEWLVGLDRRIEDVEIVEQEGRRVAAFRRSGVSLSIIELSDGYRAMLSVVLDLAIRYAQTFSALDDPLAGEALVAIDEVDLNLHPRWQRRIIDRLTRLFPGTRFVLTTHSPAVVQAAIDDKERAIAVLVLDEKPGEGTTVRRLTEGDLERLDGAEVDSVMVDDAVFDVPSRLSPTYEALEVEAAELRRKLEDGAATARDRQRLLKVLDELQGVLAREEEREGKGPLLSEIARTQIALLRVLDSQLTGKGGGRRDPAPAKGRRSAR
ncbi:AAA family ATPase [Sorangium sp. So ce1000]|uniref:AAA family ATPase n=1 Tax=Sorangium sp. So ce1000 TaxID=3133325 RepID=UPI003F6487ED